MLRLRFVLLVAVVAVTGHDATYAISVGLRDYGAALSATGHDAYWGSMALGVAAVLIVAVGATAARWWYLRRQLDAMGARAVTGNPLLRPLRVLRLTTCLAAVALGVFVLQETVEAARVGVDATTVGVLEPAGVATAAVVFGLVAALFALLSELADARIGALERALATSPALPRPNRILQRPHRDLARYRRQLLAPVHRGRAPPVARCTSVF